MASGCAATPLIRGWLFSSAAALSEQCQQEAAAIERRASSDLHVLVDPPFVIAGDIPRPELEAQHRNTVRAAARVLWGRYVAHRPQRPVVVLLFRDEKSYRHYAQAWFGDRDVPYFGYFRTLDNTLLLNIATGSGTLVHELTHALTAADFPGIPDWLNEGFASLFEECVIGENDIRGRVNWRLPTLQQAIEQDRLQPLRELFTNPEFRGRNEVLNYAQARYFCMFLQERGRLGTFYRSFRERAAQDPTGAQFVRKVFNDRPLEHIDYEFQHWAERLVYPPAFSDATHVASIR